MDTVIVVLGNATIEAKYLDLEADWVGVDYGAFICASNNIHMRYAVGDFDSVTPVEFEHIQLHSFEIVTLDKIKDDSDFEAALDLVKDYKHILVLGGLGNRFDHAYVNLQLLKSHSNMTLLDAQNKLWCVNKGDYLINKGDYTYLSVFALEESAISLSGVKYPLEDRQLAPTDLYTLSNEILDQQAKLSVKSGSFLVVQSKD